MTDPETLLIVEDDPEFSNYLKRLLRHKDLHILTADSGKQAIECLNANSVDLVLQDIGLPDIDGYQVVDHVHQTQPEALVIVMTGEVTVESAIQALRHGAYDYLRKPFATTELINTVDNALDRIRLERRHKEAQEKLRESEQQFRDLIENSPVCIAIIQNDRVVYENPELKKFHGLFSEDNLLNFIDYVHPDDLTKVKQAHAHLVSKESDTVEIDFRFQPPSGNGNQRELLWFQCRATRFLYQGREALLLNAVDITEAKQLEHQLLIKNKMLSLGRVAAGIAHEIRNPLTGINTYLYTIEDLCESDQLSVEDMEIIRQVITQIQVASNKIESVIKRVMDFSKPGAPKMVRTNINESLKEAIELSAVTMRKNGIRIEKSLASNLPQCYADPQLIEQVVLNLITNAARAMERSNGNSKVVSIKSSARDNTLSIQVADSGPGVPVKLRDKIFDPFFTTKEDGSGIGLNIAQRIVADHNGTISLGKSIWGGAEFTIELPIERRMYTR